MINQRHNLIVLAALAGFGRRATAAELTARTGLHATEVDDALEELVGDGLVAMQWSPDFTPHFTLVARQ